MLFIVIFRCSTTSLASTIHIIVHVTMRPTTAEPDTPQRHALGLLKRGSIEANIFFYLV